MSKEFLRRLPLFAGLSDLDLDQLYEMAEPVTLAEDEFLITEGDIGDALYVVLDGEVEITRRSGAQELVLAVKGSGEVLGEMALLEQAPRNASVKTLCESHFLKISQAAFHQLLACSPSAPLAMLQTITSRLRSTEQLLMQHEKMASLGTLAAGLAHELNNPAAAARRSADQLREVLSDWQRLDGELVALTFTREQAERIASLRSDMMQCDQADVALDPLLRSDREGEVEGWLEEHGIEEAWELAPTLVSFGWDTSALEPLAESFTEAQLAVVVPWLTIGCSAYSLLGEVGKSAERISEIVKAVKMYSYLDQAPVQEVNVHDSLENTLVILRHKLKGGIQIKRDYAPDLPTIEAYGSELNQVWTNLIDNAIDAMNGEGELGLRTYGGEDRVVVEIRDTGPGIPPQLQKRIFDPFFTTKPPGVGSGLGLYIVYNIVADRHRGEIKLTSQPCDTCFQISLPIQLARG